MLYYSPIQYLASRLQHFHAGVFSFQGIDIFITIECFIQNGRITGIAMVLMH